MSTLNDAMAPYRALLVLFVSIISLSLAAEDLCTNQWDLEVEGVNESDLTIHHSSTFVPGLFTHLVWHWRQNAKSAGTLWLSQAQKRGKFSGGFVGQYKSGFKLPASLQWTLYNGSLSLSAHGDPRELMQYPAWRVVVCNGLLVWGVTDDKELYVTYDEVNETRSLDETRTAKKIFKRQAEFPVVPEEGQKSNGTFTTWWRRFIDSIGGSYQGDKPRSWILDITELLMKLVISAFRPSSQGGLNIASNPDAEEISRTYRDVESVSENSNPNPGVPKRLNGFRM